MPTDREIERGNADRMAGSLRRWAYDAIGKGAGEAAVCEALVMIAVEVCAGASSDEAAATWLRGVADAAARQSGTRR